MISHRQIKIASGKFAIQTPQHLRLEDTYAFKTHENWPPCTQECKKKIGCKSSS